MKPYTSGNPRKCSSTNCENYANFRVKMESISIAAAAQNAYSEQMNTKLPLRCSD